MDKNPFSPPASKLDQHHDRAKNKFFSLAGRIGRSSYCWRIQTLLIIPFLVLKIIGLALRNYMINAPHSFNITYAASFRDIFAFVLLSFFVLCYLFAFLPVTARLRDIGYSPWLSLILFIPVANLGLIIFLLFRRGDAFTNRFGLMPEKHVLTRVFSVALAPFFAYVIFSILYFLYSMIILFPGFQS